MMDKSIVLLGSTDFTLALAEAALSAGVSIGAIVHVGTDFEISYAKDGVKNYRAVDIEGWCADHNIRAIPFESFGKLTNEISAHTFSAAVLAGWYHMVPRSFREMFPRGCIGFHASLLPKLRGGAPLNWAILSGLSETGVSMFSVGDGVDDGDLFDQERIAISPNTYIAELVSASASASALMVQRSLPAILSGELKPHPQSGDATYCMQRTPEDGRIEWSISAARTAVLVRAVSRPYPGALCLLDGQEIAIHAARVFENTEILGAAGQILNLPATRFPVAVCGDGCLEIQDAIFQDGEDALPRLRRSSHKRFET